MENNTNPTSDFAEVDNNSAHEVNHQIEMIPIDDLVPDKHQPRQFKDSEKYLKGLMDNITSCREVYTPIQYRIGDDGKKYIVMGERRWRAAKAAGLTEIPAMEYKGTQDYRIAAYMDNQNRKKLLPMEEALYLKRLMEEMGLEQQELAEKVNLSASRLSEKLKIAALDEDIQTKALAGPEWTAQKLLELTKLENKEDRDFVFARMCKSLETTKSATKNDGENADKISDVASTEVDTEKVDDEQATIPASYSITQINKWKKSITAVRKKVTNAIPICLNKKLIDAYQSKIEGYFQDIEDTYVKMLEELEVKTEVTETVVTTTPNTQK